MKKSTKPKALPREGKEQRMPEELKCHCGCNGRAEYLCNGKEYDGKDFTNEPCCLNAMLYLRDASEEFIFPFTATAI